MPIRPDQLRATARAAIASAERARSLAVELGIRGRLLDGRIGPCVHAHRADVWNSRAATASRQMLVRTVVREVATAQREMQRTRFALERHALRLEARARLDLARSDELEALMLAAVQAAGGS